MNKLIIIRGPLGIGKTTIAKKLAVELQAEYISVDEVLRDNGLEKDEDYLADDFIKVNKIIIPKINKILEKQYVIVEGNFYFKEALEHLLKETDSSTRIFTLKSSLATCLKRDAERENTLGPLATEAIYNLVNQFDYGINIDCKNGIKEVTEAIKNKI
ncbi:MAG: AAA family ATPase [Patescibacteria group bacterium]|jgi:tRNA uridine 5-carbamoylmethylation protein Kti12